jgi:hypothetical protein
MKTQIKLSLILLVALATNQTMAQDTGFFSGNGFKDDWGTASSRGTGSNLGSSKYGFHQGTRSDDDQASAFGLPRFKMPKLKTPKFEMPKLFQTESYPKPVQLTDSEDTGILSGFPRLDLFSPRDSSQPGFFQRMNNRTRQMFGQTSEGLSNLSDRSRSTWDSITRGLGGEFGSAGEEKDVPPVQPNLRSSRSVEGSMSRF